MSTKKKLLEAAAGNAGGGATYVDDVFSTFLYTGDGTARDIVNGIDLDGEGGLVWTKSRSAAVGHALVDTENGVGTYLRSDSNAALRTDSYAQEGVTSFNSDGYSLGNWTNEDRFNRTNYTYASWTFRKQPGFFDVVTYTGTGVARTISHNLGSAPGMIITKVLNISDNWGVYHASLGGTKRLTLNDTAASSTTSRYWNNTDATDSVFTVGIDDATNGNGKTYVAYLFAHDAQEFGTDEDESIIKCGSYTGSAGHFVDLGWEPQWVMIKKATGASLAGWYMFDNMRGAGASDIKSPYLQANTSAAETSHLERLNINPTGFTLPIGDGDFIGSDTYIYMAIRRPNKPAEEFDATDLFDVQKDFISAYSSAGFPVDMVLGRSSNSTQNWRNFARMIGGNFLVPNDYNAEASLPAGEVLWDSNSGFYQETNGTPNIWHQWRRVPGFFDVVAYAGNNTLRTVDHNLGVAPELVIIKIRNAVDNWEAWTSYTSMSSWYRLNDNTSSFTPNYFNSTSPTSTQFTLNSTGVFSVNQSGYNYIAYLFASADGISKVGSYTGTGNDLNVDCGFSAGARFILIRRTDSSGDWYVWDSERGIVAGNDPYLLLNTTAAQVTNTDYIDPLSSGFTVTSSAPAALNASGGTYIFYAIA